MKFIKTIYAVILFVLAALAGPATAAQDNWKTSYQGGSHEFYSDNQDLRFYIACPTEDKSPDAVSSVSLNRVSTGHEIGKFQIIAGGNTYDGPFKTSSRVDSQNFRSLMTDLRKGGATIKYALGSVSFPKTAAAKFFPAVDRKFPCQTGF